MTTTILIQFDDGSQHQVVLSDEAKEAIRFSFNPSGLPGVNRLKALSGAFITLCNELSLASGASREFPGAGREFAVAKTEMQTASMWAVLGATKDLKPAVPSDAKPE